MLYLEKIDPQFRILIDQLFFTDRMDLDLSNFPSLLESKEEHRQYLWDRFDRASEIFWPESFWVARFEFLLSLNRKYITDIEPAIFSRLQNLIFSDPNAHPQYNNQHIQFIAWSKAKALRKEDLGDIKKYLLSLPLILQTDVVIGLIPYFVPHIFSSVEEYVQLVSQNINQATHNYPIIKQFEDQGFSIDREPFFKTAKGLCFKRAFNKPNRRSFFNMINDTVILIALKADYQPDLHRSRLINLLNKCEYKEIEEYHLRNITNLLELDASIADDLLAIYADKLYARGTGIKGANIRKLIRVCKTFPQFSPKKVLAWLSSHNILADIKTLASSFPELKPLVPFV